MGSLLLLESHLGVIFRSSYFLAAFIFPIWDIYRLYFDTWFLWFTQIQSLASIILVLLLRLKVRITNSSPILQDGWCSWVLSGSPAFARGRILEQTEIEIDAHCEVGLTYWFLLTFKFSLCKLAFDNPGVLGMTLNCLLSGEDCYLLLEESNLSMKRTDQIINVL